MIVSEVREAHRYRLLSQVSRVSVIRVPFCIRHEKNTYIILTPPPKPHFYIVKLGFTGVYIIFLILLKNIYCGYSLELPLRGSSNEYPQSMFWAEMWKILEFSSFGFWWWNFQYIWIDIFS